MYTRLHRFKFNFFLIFWGGAHRAPSPDPSPRFFSGCALGSGFALNSRALRALGSGFALNTRALRIWQLGHRIFLPPMEFNCPPMHNFLATGLFWPAVWETLKWLDTSAHITFTGAIIGSVQVYSRYLHVNSSQTSSFSLFCGPLFHP